MARFCSEQVSPASGKVFWEEWRRESVILRQGLQIGQGVVSEVSNSKVPNKHLGSGAPGSLAPRACSPGRALALVQPRARAPRASSSLGTAGDPRADAQTDRRRGAGRSPAAPGSVNQRRIILLLSTSHPAPLARWGHCAGL